MRCKKENALVIREGAKAGAYNMELSTKNISQAQTSYKPKTHTKISPSSETEELRQLLRKTFASNVKKICAEINRSPSTVYAGLDRHTPPKFSLFNLIGLLRASGDHAILSWLVGKLGYTLYKLPKNLGNGNLAQIQGDFLTVTSMTMKYAVRYFFTGGKEKIEITEQLLKHLSWVISSAVRFRAALEEAEKK
ncbi:MAG: hypothetical protein JW734_06485 [Candidatus Omnitrophica bacterium]|nr:hypothetical protein [Candidatus Omnitrophota bacterium]